MRLKSNAERSKRMRSSLNLVVLCGFFLFLGYAFQNFGLMNTTATKSAFITSISVLIVPLLLVSMNIQKVKIRIWVAVLMATLGLYLLILPGGNGINIGDVITFGCAISFALHIIAQDIYIKKEIRLLPFFFVQSSHFLKFFFHFINFLGRSSNGKSNNPCKNIDLA